MVYNFNLSVKLSEQIRPWDPLACCWDVKQATNNPDPVTPGAWQGSQFLCCDSTHEKTHGKSGDVTQVRRSRSRPIATRPTRWLACERGLFVVGCLTSQQHASVSQGRICSDNFTCCHTEIEVADQTFYLIQSQYTDTGPTSPSSDPKTPEATGVPIFKSLV